MNPSEANATFPLISTPLNGRNFFKYQNLDKWKEDLQEVLNYSLSKYTDGFEIELLAIYFHLTKLIEAAHLIDVREITHIGGQIKNRF